MADELHEEIARYAYKLFEARGRAHGFDLRDWYDAEQAIGRNTPETVQQVEETGFSFRFKVNVAPRSSISADTSELVLLTKADGHHVKLTGDASRINESSRLFLKSRWRSLEEAQDSGAQLGDVFALALVRNRVGVEHWPRRGGTGFFTAAGLLWVGAGSTSPTLNDQLGLTVYKTSPRPRFVSLGPATLRVGASAVRFAESFLALVAVKPKLNDRERVAIDLYNASFFEPAEDTRFITLVMAIEALLDLAPRPAESVALVDSFIDAVNASALQKTERNSLIGSLRWLRKESIRSAGRRLCERRLRGKTYEGQAAAKFFDYCYDLRSQLVHGGELRGAREDAGRAAAQLELLVSDLIVSRFLPI